MKRSISLLALSALVLSATQMHALSWHPRFTKFRQSYTSFPNNSSCAFGLATLGLLSGSVYVSAKALEHNSFTPQSTTPETIQAKFKAVDVLSQELLALVNSDQIIAVDVPLNRRINDTLHLDSNDSEISPMQLIGLIGEYDKQNHIEFDENPKQAFQDKTENNYRYSKAALKDFLEKLPSKYERALMDLEKQKTETRTKNTAKAHSYFRTSMSLLAGAALCFIGMLKTGGII